MLKIKSEELFDLNKVGLYVTIIIAFLVLFYPIKTTYLLILETLFIGYGIYLIYTIKRNKGSSILINNQDKWFVNMGDETCAVELKDYWLVKQYLFIWVKGTQKSVSFMVTRSIIGEHKFSLLRTKIK